MEVATQYAKLKEIHRLVSKRPEYMCNFVDGAAVGHENARIVYRHYATLWFCMIVDSSESELGILDLIQVFVESLDEIFVNVCELDLVFRPEEVSQILGEIISGGLVLSTDVDAICAAVAK